MIKSLCITPHSTMRQSSWLRQLVVCGFAHTGSIHSFTFSVVVVHLLDGSPITVVQFIQN